MVEVQHGHSVHTGAVLVREVRRRVREQDQQGNQQLAQRYNKVERLVPGKDYTDLLKELGIKMNSVEMSSQAAWHLLKLEMSIRVERCVIFPRVGRTREAG